MSHRFKAKIEKLFEHPISANIDVKRLLSALEHYGAEIEYTKKSRAKIFLNGEEFLLVLSTNNELSKDSVMKLRHFLEKVGLTPDTLT